MVERDGGRGEEAQVKMGWDVAARRLCARPSCSLFALQAWPATLPPRSLPVSLPTKKTRTPPKKDAHTTLALHLQAGGARNHVLNGLLSLDETNKTQ
jgi:hypothetical protein